MSWVLYNNNDNLGPEIVGTFETKEEAREALPDIERQLFYDYIDSYADDEKLGTVDRERLWHKIFDSISLISLAEYNVQTGRLD